MVLDKYFCISVAESVTFPSSKAFEDMLHVRLSHDILLFSFLKNGSDICLSRQEYKIARIEHISLRTWDFRMHTLVIFGPNRLLELGEGVCFYNLLTT